MIIVREVFIAKPGMASKLAKMFKDMVGEMGHKSRVMTDLIGQYNTVVMEGEYESLTEWEAEMKQMMEGPKDEKAPKGPSHTDMYQEGRREVYRIW
jgi:hypothetical protein